MQVMPNRTILEGLVQSVSPTADGIGTEIALEVAASAPAEGYQDFVQAAPGSVLTIYSTQPTAVRAGATYVLTTCVLGGPRGQRIVLQQARSKRAPARLKASRPG